jgi:hypothetical protein
MIDCDTGVKAFSPVRSAIVNDECIVILMIGHIAKNTIFNINV